MSDESTDYRSRAGSPSDRVPPPTRVSTTAAYGYTTGIIVATVHWLAKSYHPGSGWDWHLPDDSLIEMWVFMLLPTAHLIVKIINNRLKKLAGEDQ